MAMPSDHEKIADRQERIEQVIGAYLEAVDAGQVPDPDEWLAKHHDLQPELAEFLADQDRVRRLAEPLQAAAQAPRGDATTEPETPPEPDEIVGSQDTIGLERPGADRTTDVSAGQPPEDQPPGDGGDDGDLPRGSRVR